MSNFVNKVKEIFSAKETPKEHYLTLQFENSILQASIWELSGSKAEIIAVAGRPMDADITICGIDTANLVISDLEEKVKGINKVIFGVPHEWADGGAIKQEYQHFLKKLSSELALTPVGFVVSSDAISFFLSQEEGVPTTAVLVEILNKEVVVSIAKIGKIQGVVRKPVVQGLADAVCEALRGFSGIEVLPSRILLFGENTDLEGAKQDLISYPWLSKVDFLHFPKIDVLERLVSIKAVTYAGVSEIVGSEKLKFIWDENKFKRSKFLWTGDGSVNIDKETPESTDKEIDETVTAGEIKEETAADIKEGADMGFIQDQDIITQSDNLETVSEENFELDKVNEAPGKAENELKEVLQPENPVIPKFRMSKIIIPKIRISGLNFTFLNEIGSRFAQNSVVSRIKILPLILIVMLVLVISGILVYWNFAKAEVYLTVVTKTFDKESEITVSKNVSLIDESKMMIPGKNVTVSEKDSSSSPTSGTKITGDKAKGEVVLYNKTSDYKVFLKGTVLSTNDGLKFVLDNQASVSAQTVSETSGGATITYGKQKAAVTAVTFGSKYNLSAGSGLKIADLPVLSFEAKNEQALTGGSSREIAVVSKEDQQKLLKSLSEKLLAKAKSDIALKNGDRDKLVEQSIEAVIDKQKFTKEIDAEATDFGLDLQIKFTGTVYNDADLKSLMESTLKDIPGDYSYRPENATNHVEVKEVKKDGSIILKVKFSAKLMPKIKPDDIQNGLKGKSEEDGRLFLSTYKNVSAYDYKIKPNLPKFINAFPHIPQNIKIEISSK